MRIFDFLFNELRYFFTYKMSIWELSVEKQREIYSKIMTYDLFELSMEYNVSLINLENLKNIKQRTGYEIINFEKD